MSSTISYNKINTIYFNIIISQCGNRFNYFLTDSSTNSSMIQKSRRQGIARIKWANVCDSVRKKFQKSPKKALIHG